MYGVLHGRFRLAIFPLPEEVFMSRVDLHIHSTASDGVRSPSEIVKTAAERSLFMISITDHDTLDGIGEGAPAAADAGILFVPGVELSVDLLPGGELTAHLLGYFPGADLEDLLDQTTPLGEAIAFVQGGRQRRNPRILEKLRENGVYLLMNEVALLADGDVVGRPHIAQAMVDAGYVGNLKEAFNRFLAKGRPAYVERDRLPVAEAMEVIRGAGGLPVMAHPGYIALEKDELSSLFRRMKSLGLAGVEAYYPTHSADMEEFLLSLAGDLDLLVTGGTDFHGREDEAAPLGGVPGVFTVDTDKISDFVSICLDSKQEVASGKAQ